MRRVSFQPDEYLNKRGEFPSAEEATDDDELLQEVVQRLKRMSIGPLPVVQDSDDLAQRLKALRLEKTPAGKPRKEQRFVLVQPAETWRKQTRLAEVKQLLKSSSNRRSVIPYQRFHIDAWIKAVLLQADAPLPAATS